MKIQLKVGGTPVTGYAATADFTTDSVLVSFKHPWSFQAVGLGLLAAVNYTIECSNNDIDFFDYKTGYKDIVIPNISNGLEFEPLYMRVKFFKLTNTAGTVTFDLNLK